MIIGIPKESHPDERRVAMVPAAGPRLAKKGFEILLEPGAGVAAGFLDKEYADKGVTLAADRDAVFQRADILFQVRLPGANPDKGKDDLAAYRRDQIVIGHADPLGAPEAVRDLAETGAIGFGLELLPRITRAQSMDVLSSQATVAGYKAVLRACETLPRMFPMMMTAAGTISAARVFVIGAGVAGLQAIATARRLGAIVHAYDVRPAVKEQIESLGAKFVELPAEGGEGAGGYAKEMDEAFYRKQREKMAEVAAESDVIITTAAIPGKKSPLLITADAVARMPVGSVIVDLAAERGGNCELTKAGEVVVEHGVTIVGPLNLPSEVPYHASQMYTRNLSSFVTNLVKDGKPQLDGDDEIVRDTLLTRGGKVVNRRIRELLGMPAVDNTAGPKSDQPFDATQRGPS